MISETTKDAGYTIVPLGAGDLIDRSVRFYRRNFSSFVMIAAPPVIAGSLITVTWTLLSKTLFSAGRNSEGMELGLYYIFLWLGSMLIWFIETVATLSVMGGASRNFVRHILFGERITFRETYSNTRKRFWGLIAASSIITLVLGVIGIGILYFGLAIGSLLIIFAVAALQSIPFLAFLVGLVIGLLTVFGTIWVFFLLASRFAYVPQVMLVEGLGVFAAIGRSATLAGGSVKRLAALFVFSMIATYSALAILYVPLGWLAWTQGIEIMGWNEEILPAWYEIATQLISQASLIFLSPVWMIGLCLLYVDERVRAEGYDIELLAARRLGDIPSAPASYVNPLQPALAGTHNNVAQPPARSQFTTLGLD